MLRRALVLAGTIVAAGAGCGDCGDDFHLDASIPDAMTFGTVSLAWSLTDLDGNPVTCPQVGATTVSVELRNRTIISGVAASFSCGNSPSTSQVIPSGLYDVSFRLNGGGATTLATPADQSGVLVRGGQNTVLAPVVFPVDASGSLVLTLGALNKTSNCGGAPAGADITNMTLTLVQASGSCATTAGGAAITFIRARGNTQLGTYTVNCSAPQTATCIETDETLTVPRMPSGAYTVHVRGKVAGAECWKNDDMFQVPPQGRVQTQPLNLAYDATVVGCPPM